MRLGELLFERGERKEGERHLRQGIINAPENIQMFYRFCIEFLRGNWRETIRLYETLHEPLKQSHEALIIMAQALINEKETGRAAGFLKKALIGISDQYLEAELHYAQALIHWLRGENGKQRDELLKADMLARGTGNASLSKAWLLLLDERLDEAERSARRALWKRPFFAEANWLLGIIHEKRGNSRIARRFHKRAHRLFPENTRYRESLSESLP